MSPQIVVAIDVGMTCTGRIELASVEEYAEDATQVFVML